jgi:hypothetical protein
LIDQLEQADEVLLLTYSLNLAFWERFALGRARALGALVTVVADPTVAEVDTAAVRHAGVSYLDGRAMCAAGGAFHPKLVVIAGEDHTHVAVGSGNVTVGGWHGNAELWTVLHARAGSTPAALHDLAGWLSRLPERVTFSPKVDDALGRAATHLRKFSVNDDGPSLVHNLDRPLLEALPSEAVDELTVYAPFFDRSGDALDALAKRFTPKRMRVLVQRDQTVVDGVNLERVVRGHRGQVALLRSDRYHHGKLIEWHSNGQRRALVGSPNLSGAALLKPMAEGGNCELALLCDLDQSLAPEAGSPVSGEEIAALQWRPRNEPRPAITLLSALLDQDGLHLMLGKPLPSAAILQAADRRVESDGRRAGRGTRTRPGIRGPGRNRCPHRDSGGLGLQRRVRPRLAGPT